MQYKAETFPRVDAPHLSVVAVSRNDDHGGDLLGRMQHFVNGFIAQCLKHDLKAELILVEWNPPPERLPLVQALEWPNDFGSVRVKVVTVPPDVHARFAHSASLPLFQMIGKNVGIRRARGRYVLATNIDILFDDATIIYLRDCLVQKTLLRADRYDVPGDLPKGTHFDRILSECHSRFFQINTCFGVFDAQRRRYIGMGNGLQARLLALHSEIRIFGIADPINRAIKRSSISLHDATKKLSRSLSYGLSNWIAVLKQSAIALSGALRIACLFILYIPSYLRRNVPKLLPLRTMPHRGYWYFHRTFRGPVALLRRAFSFPFRVVRFPFRVVRHLLIGLSLARRSLAKAWQLILRPHFILTIRPSFFRKSQVNRRLAVLQRLHTNACGDFTLLAREDWFRLRGYPEWPIFSWHIDSVFLCAASVNGMKQIALGPEYRTFHIDHSQGSGWSPAGAVQLFARLDRNAIPYLSDEDVSQMQNKFAKDPSAANINGEHWGLIDFVLPEQEVSKLSPNNSSEMRQMVDLPHEAVRA